MNKINLNKTPHIAIFRECGKLEMKSQYPNITKGKKDPTRPKQGTRSRQV